MSTFPKAVQALITRIFMTAAQDTSTPTLEALQDSLTQLKATGIKLDATRQQYEQKMQRSRKWNMFAVAIAAVVCLVAWINHASPWLRWGILPLTLFLTLFFEAMRRLLGLTMQSSIRQLQIQIGSLEKQMNEARASQAKLTQENAQP